ncbi:uncharacterized protein LOC127835446 isoform X2 [Dreissena polymorpha]|uniref:uncharacterized protein LOC127835446 isoform X2 n=1 Tax=Dreissena polymorpha TaxID=45954 RepID=UPI0022648688|nr:uncharacterized protein LOC127835446 isoform X2 [Dreissena polymorpha]
MAYPPKFTFKPEYRVRKSSSSSSSSSSNEDDEIDSVPQSYLSKVSLSTFGISLVPYAATDVMKRNGTSQTIYTRMQVISAMDQFKLYSLEELRYFDGRLLETTAVVGPNTIGKNQQLVYPQGTEEEEVLGEKQTLTTKHLCITAIKEYEYFSLEEVRYADSVLPKLVKQLENERHNYLKRKPTQTLATNALFSFKCEPKFGEASLRNPDETITSDSSSTATTRITSSLSNPVSMQTLATDAPFAFTCVPKFIEANFHSFLLRNPDKTFTLDSSSSAATSTASSLSNPNPVSIPTLATEASFSFKCEPTFGEANSRNPDKTFKLGCSSSATTQSLSNPPSIQTLVPVRSGQCRTASLDNNNAISSKAPNIQVTVKETCAREGPDVLDLFVGGTHKYTTLLTTMIQAKAGFLADIFLGKGNTPLHVLKDGSFFLDTDGESFKLIIEYLRDGRLPDMGIHSTKGTTRREELLLKSFQTARKYGLHEYLHDIDQYAPIQRFKELESNTVIVEFYAKQILWALNTNDLERNGKFAIMLKSTNSTAISAVCCEHDCKFAPVDTVVHLTRDLSLQILSLLCQRLRCLGYNVTTNEESCVFRCSTHEEGDADRKECTSRRHLLTWFCRI